MTETWWFVYPESYVKPREGDDGISEPVNPDDWFREGYCSLGYGSVGPIEGQHESLEEILTKVTSAYPQPRFSEHVQKKKAKELTVFSSAIAIGDYVVTTRGGDDDRLYVGRVTDRLGWHPRAEAGHERQYPTEWLNEQMPIPPPRGFRRNGDTRLLFEITESHVQQIRTSLKRAHVPLDVSDSDDVSDSERAQDWADEVLDGHEMSEGVVSGKDWTLRAIALRRGQARFRKFVLDAYEGRCAVSGCDVEEVIEAAHITPVSEGGSNQASNGLPLRSDIHVLFDMGVIAFVPVGDDQVVVDLHPELRQSDSYSDLHGRALRSVSANHGMAKPDPDALSRRRARCKW